MVFAIVRNVSEWVSKKDEFKGISLEDLISWAAVLEGGWHAHSIRRRLWIPPLYGILKLYFDGSYQNSIQKGGIEGVTRDFSSNIAGTHSGPMVASDANEVEVFAILVGCRELHNLGGQLAIIEGDSFQLFNGGSGMSSHPWGLPDWAEEVQDISVQLDAPFITFLEKTMKWLIVLQKEFLLFMFLLMFNVV